MLLQEVVEALTIKRDGVYLDGTFGAGGHSLAVLQGLGKEGRLFAMDRDPEAQKFTIADPRFELQQRNFADVRQWALEKALMEKVNGVLVDLGVSSPQLDEARRGFSFQRMGPLDMRMDQQHGVSAAQWLNEISEQRLKQVVRQYGEERFAGRIASAIVNNRPISTTVELAALIASVVPYRDKHKHPATRTFQAIRIYLNNELEALERFLDHVIDVLAPSGRLAVISFHSLEDRIVKQRFRLLSKGEPLPRRIPVRHADASKPRMNLVGKFKRASEAEIARNPRARSAVLRVVEKLS